MTICLLLWSANMIPKSIEHLTKSQFASFRQAYNTLKNNYENGIWFESNEDKRAITRTYYMQCKSFNSGFISNSAWLAKQKGVSPCFEHSNLPQPYCYFIMKNWNSIGESFETFFPHWITSSTGLYVTSKENTKLSKYTINNNSTGNTLKVTVPLFERYKKAKIIILDAVTLKEVDFDSVTKNFDMRYCEFEKKELLI